MKLSAPPSPVRRVAAFTMIEIAICLAVISFALVAIIGVLPMGMQVQRDNREDTIINQDATIFATAIRNGARGMDDLTNYVMAVTITTTEFTSQTQLVGGANIVTFTNPYAPPSFVLPNLNPYQLTDGQRIVGLLGTPKFLPSGVTPGNWFSNHVVAYVRSMSGLAAEKSPQTNANVTGDAFAYRLICENLPVASYDGNTPYGNRLTNNLRDLRLTFRWPLSVRGEPGNGRQTFRTLAGGQLAVTNGFLFFFQPQAFTPP